MKIKIVVAVLLLFISSFGKGSIYQPVANKDRAAFTPQC